MFAEICSMIEPLEPPSEAPASLAFGRFQVVPHRREFHCAGQPIKLGGRAFDVLMALIDAKGTVVSKDALLARVWPDRVVEENNLQGHISALRAALGPERGLIRTVSGRGYQFTGEIRVLLAPAGGRGCTRHQVTPDEVPPPTNLCEPVSELFGRDDELREILRHAAAHRLITLTGPGGIGKTRLALAVASQLGSNFLDGVWVAEFSPLADPNRVPVTIAAAVGLEVDAGEITAQRLARALSGRKLLLVLDTCEHVITAAAAVADTILRASPMVRIIATSREPLRADGEQVYSVPPLAVPASDDEDPWQHGAVRLFLARSRASGTRVFEDRRAAAVVAAICRRLDGLPLAIELAAGHVAGLGIDELAARLHGRFQLLTGGWRTALPRHQTLRATLDWSYRLLTEPERVVLRGLAVFAGGFSLEAARAVATLSNLTALEVVEGLSNLIAKSFVAAKVDGTSPRYWLFDTTRAYALEKLLESGERQRMARRHAEYFRDFFERLKSDRDSWPTTERLTDPINEIDNLRAALDWAFSPDGDTAIAMALTAASVGLGVHLSPLERVPRSDRAGDLQFATGPCRRGLFGAGIALAEQGNIGRPAASFSDGRGGSRSRGAIVGARGGDLESKEVAARVHRSTQLRAA
jgi:predicted ATPase/DNA-binding winged helix-turn-helix (wHTH) protein